SNTLLFRSSESVDALCAAGSFILRLSSVELRAPAFCEAETAGSGIEERNMPACAKPKTASIPTMMMQSQNSGRVAATCRFMNDCVVIEIFPSTSPVEANSLPQLSQNRDHGSCTE